MLSQSGKIKPKQRKIYIFMKDCLKIEDLTIISMVDFHRLPQRPIYRDYVELCRPVIIKLSNTADKHLIFSHLKNLKEYNAARAEIIVARFQKSSG